MPLDQSKIIFRNGPSDRLPRALLPGELGVTVDDGKVFIGPDQRYGLKQSDRLAPYPYRNIEILTEQTDAEFSAMHSERMREGIYHNYYEARLEPDTVRWTDVGVVIDSDLIDYRITLNDNVTAFIDYTIVTNESGEAIRKGRMILWHTGGEVSFTDNASQSRDRTLIGHSSYDPRDVFGRIKFRFIEVDGALAFQYRNWSFDAHTMNFKVSRPYISIGDTVIYGNITATALVDLEAFAASTLIFGTINTSIIVSGSAIGNASNPSVVSGSIISNINPAVTMIGQASQRGSLEFLQSNTVVVSEEIPPPMVITTQPLSINFRSYWPDPVEPPPTTVELRVSEGFAFAPVVGAYDLRIEVINIPDGSITVQLVATTDPFDPNSVTALGDSITFLTGGINQLSFNTNTLNGMGGDWYIKVVLNRNVAYADDVTCLVIFLLQ